jgi:hypothetical protein
MSTLNDSECAKKCRKVFVCNICDYTTSQKSHYDKHILTRKHKNSYIQLQNSHTINEKNAEIELKKFACLCGNKYKYRQGLYLHKKTCDYKEEKLLSDKEIILHLIKENSEFKELLKEQTRENKQMLLEQSRENKEIIQKNKEETNNLLLEIINTNTCIQNITNNKLIKPTFNLNFFLNETCKNAMNLVDFIEQSKIEFNDFLKLESVGFVNGISNIIVKNLKALDIDKRPVHCTDSKRGTVYIKDNDEWEKENEEKSKLRKLIKKVANKNAKLLPEFKLKYPDCIKSNSKYTDQYNKLIIESLGGQGDNETEKEDKIILKIAKEIIVDK